MSEGKIRFCQARPPEAKELAVPAPELFVLHMNAAFGKFPCELGKDQLERLEGMRATWTDVSANPYDALCRAIRRYERIAVWIDHESTTAHTATGGDVPLEKVREVLEVEAKRRNEA
jgi:hypothetical protein